MAKPHIICVTVLWALLTLINLEKAYHIDDTFHLEAANHLASHPSNPMSGLINWDDQRRPMYEYNQPPLFFYVISIYRTAFGSSEIALHLFMSVFSLLALIYFYKLLELLSAQTPIVLLILFASCPAFVVNQNVMTDVPILALSLAIMFHLLKGRATGNTLQYLVSAVLLSVGLLIKYSLSPLFIVIFIAIASKREFNRCAVLLVPLLVLFVWSVWNIHEFNAVHVANRASWRLSFNKLVGFFGTLGAVSVFSAALMYSLVPRKPIIFVFFGAFLLLVGSAFFVYAGWIEGSLSERALNWIFIANGFAVAGLVGTRFLASLVEGKMEYVNTPYFVIGIYIMGVAAFIILFAPFNATRHILLIIPFILLLSHRDFVFSRGPINNLVLSASVLLGTALGLSDWFYADFYRKHVKEIKVEDGSVWSLGHWGWQWYTKRAGMRIYGEADRDAVQKGDYFVFPKGISQQQLYSGIKLDTVDFITDSPTAMTLFSGKNFASMYTSSAKKPAWSLSMAPIDTIFICRVIMKTEAE